jgi:hypothetical protein
MCAFISLFFYSQRAKYSCDYGVNNNSHLTNLTRNSIMPCQEPLPAACGWISNCPAM